MDSGEKEQLINGVYPSRDPAVGRYLWAIQDTRQRTLGQLAGLPPAALDWRPPDNGSTIGTILYHIAAIELDWLYVEVLERPFSPEGDALFPYDPRDEHGLLTRVAGFTLEQHLQRLETVRGWLLDVYEKMDLADFRLPRSLPKYDVTPEWVLHHLMQHEAEHRSQIGALVRAARSAGS